jgi:hypothetical protein
MDVPDLEVVLEGILAHWLGRHRRTVVPGRLEAGAP